MSNKLLAELTTKQIDDLAKESGYTIEILNSKYKDGCIIKDFYTYWCTVKQSKDGVFNTHVFVGIKDCKLVLEF